MLDQSESVRMNIPQELTKVNAIQSVRPSDGARIVAIRVVVGKRTPIRWEVMITDRFYHSISMKQLSLKRRGESTHQHFLTRELSQCAEAVGFLEWEQLPIGMRKSLVLVNGRVRRVLLPEYQAPDPTDYPLE